MELSFNHVQSAHCENGVTRNLLNHIGIEQMTEPLAFGIGSGLFFIYIPFVKINNGPAISYRTMPGMIFNRACKSLQVPLLRKKFNSEEAAKAYLDEAIASGTPVGCQVGVYYLPYFPREYRFHFNAHNLVIYGKENDEYLVSDPVMEHVTRLNAFDLNRVRFSKGFLAPKGQLYYPKEHKTVSDDLVRKAILTGMKRNIRHMLHAHVPILGVDGIRFTAHRIRKWKSKLGDKAARSYLAQLVRMQEEIGTGGGGFRFIYAAFLQESSAYFPEKGLVGISEQFTKSGDLWRSVAVQAAGIYKGRLGGQQDYDHLSQMMMEIADIEGNAFRNLSKTLK
ncbi:MAG: BtrH N-terminal domain-containing protein [Cyclobacteriaceae bacterium]|nr:BtrH N-terminal domain-containing protein [Cyclobacteriaceae bacterium]